MELYDQIQEAGRVVRKRYADEPTVGIILGTGLGGLAEEISDAVRIPYEEIPHFPISTVATHMGRLVCGKLGGKSVLAMEGRFHFYEGYSLKQITFPVRVMRALGCSTLIVSNACGGMNPQWAKGDLMLIEDHINLLGDNPLIGKNDDRLGVRFPDMCHPYDKDLLMLAQRIALEEQIVCHKGVFVAVPGPNLETRAEYRFLRGIGADVVGMSTVPEVIVGVHANLRILGISVITDMCLPDALEPASLPEIIATANTAEKKLRVLVRRVVAELEDTLFDALSKEIVMDLVWFLLIGLAAGWLAGQIMKGGYGLIGDLIVGVIGALLGGYLFGLLGLAASGLIGSLITATVGAIILIALLRFIKTRT